MKPVVAHTRISASPEVVRAKFLDFSSLESYKPTFIQSVTLVDKSKSPSELVPGDKLICILDGRRLDATVATNTSSCFSWTGTLMKVLSGTHQFRFESAENGQATDFFHEETFTGPLSWMLDDTFLARRMGVRAQVVNNYEGFNVDFKKWVESSQCSGPSDSKI
ncbi:hypothetical protein DL98DRAFT_576102 [Cadophora sp. DSE1049]|nr:hypothetical protein DL98DRAFT_576102 [Cadophora sp. DSE1049]